MIERHGAAVGDHAVDELHLVRLDHDRVIALAHGGPVGFGQGGELLVEDIIFVDANHP